MDYNERIEQIRDAWQATHPNPGMEAATAIEPGSWVERVRDDSIVVEIGPKKYEVAYTEVDDEIIFAPLDEWVEVELSREYTPAKGNALKAIRSDKDTLTVGNYIVLFGGRDISGLRGRGGGFLFSGGPRNRDGTHGEFFTKATALESDYTATGQLLIDWEHGRRPDRAGDPGRDDVLGYVNWKSATIDDKGVWVERVLNRRNAYVQWIETLLAENLIGTSSEPVQKGVEVGEDGEIKKWELKRDTLTVMPFEHRMLNDNALTAVKGLASLDAAFLPLLPTEPKPSGEDAGASCAVKVGAAKALQLLIEIERT